MRNKIIDDRYRVIACIGLGAMGRVYEAEHVYTKRPVALKVIHPQYQRNEQYRIRFLKEIELACRVQHPNAVQILDAGEVTSGMLYMAMEYLNGHTLSHVLKKWPRGMGLKAALHIAQQIGFALDAVHSAGLVHRDLKPDNIMVLSEPGAPLHKCQVKILDFGIASDLGTTHSLTGKGMIGTPKFMSPEQTRGERLTQQSDIYNLGLILYAMLTGKEPFSSDSPVGYVFHHNMTQPEPVSSVRSDIPMYIDWAIQKALSKDPATRFDSALTLVEALQEKKPLAQHRIDHMPIARHDKQRMSSILLRKGAFICAAALLMVFALMSTLTRSSGPSAHAGEIMPYLELVYDSSGVETESVLPADSIYSTVQITVSDSIAGSMAEEPVTELEPEITSQEIVSQEEETIRTDEEEVDLNISYYANLKTQPEGGAQQNPIEGNLNILRLRAQQQRFQKARSSSEADTSSGDMSNSERQVMDAQPRVQGGMNRLRSRIHYPTAAIMAEASGTVAIKVLIDEHGKMAGQDITQFLGFGCEEEVLRVLKTSQFEPAKANGQPIKAWLDLKFEFQLIG